MLISTNKQSNLRSNPKRMAALLSPETLRILALGRQRGWNSAILGRAPLPDKPVRLGDWLIVPAHQDTSPVPSRALERVQTVFAAGLRPKGFVVVHEAPLLLPAPEDVETETIRVPSDSPVNKRLIAVAGALGVLSMALTALTVASLLAAPTALVVGAVMLDPILVAVTEDDYWIEIDRWWN